MDRHSPSTIPNIPLVTTSVTTNGPSTNNKLKSGTSGTSSQIKTPSPTPITSTSSTNGRQSVSPFGSPIFQQQQTSLDPSDEISKPKNGDFLHQNFLRVFLTIFISGSSNNFSTNLDKNVDNQSSSSSSDLLSRHQVRDQMKSSLHDTR